MIRAMPGRAAPLWAGLVFFAATLPNLLLSPIAGTFVDRWDHKEVMVVSDILRAAVREGTGDVLRTHRFRRAQREGGGDGLAHPLGPVHRGQVDDHDVAGATLAGLLEPRNGLPLLGSRPANTLRSASGATSPLSPSSRAAAPIHCPRASRGVR